jgi:archaellum component FlaC
MSTGDSELSQSIENLEEMIESFSKAQTDAMLMALGANVLCFIETLQRKPKQAREMKTNHINYLRQLGVSENWLETTEKLFDTIVERYEKLEDQLNKTAKKLSAKGMSEEDIKEELKNQAAKFVLEH